MGHVGIQGLIIIVVVIKIGNKWVRILPIDVEVQIYLGWICKTIWHDNTAVYGDKN